MHVSRIQFERPFAGRVQVQPGSPWLPTLLLVLWMAALGLAMAFPVSPDRRLSTDGAVPACPIPDISSGGLVCD